MGPFPRRRALGAIGLALALGASRARLFPDLGAHHPGQRLPAAVSLGLGPRYAASR